MGVGSALWMDSGGDHTSLPSYCFWQGMVWGGQAACTPARRFTAPEERKSVAAAVNSTGSAYEGPWTCTHGKEAWGRQLYFYLGE